MKIINNKKATENWATGDMPFFIIFCAALGFFVIIFLSIMSYFVSKDVEIPKDVEGVIFMERFYNSPYCFAYQDEITGRVYQKSVHWKKFIDENTMNKCFSSKNYKYAFKFELENPESSDKISISTPNWVEGSNFKLEQKHVFVYYNDKIKDEKLLISVQNA